MTCLYHNVTDMVNKKTRSKKPKPNILKLADPDLTEAERIQKMLEGQRVRDVAYLQDEAANGKGIARMQAIDRLEQMSREIEDAADKTVTISFVEPGASVSEDVG